jgi:hypothetical protein
VSGNAINELTSGQTLVVPFTSTLPLLGAVVVKRNTTETEVTKRATTLNVAEPVPALPSLAVALSAIT